MPKKKIAYIGIAMIIVLAILGYVFLFNRLTKNDIEVSNYDFLVVADSYDNTGLDLDSGFIITANEDYSVSDVKNFIKMSPEVEYDIKKSGHATYYLKTDDNLESDSIYNIYVQNEQNIPINSWAFQTKTEFKVLSTLPANNEICTNLDTGIQIDFSKKVENIDDYFEITPSVDGKISYIGKSMTFIPKEKLVDGQEYKVKIKAGATSFDGDKLNNDYEFSFKAEEYYYFSQKIVLRNSNVNFTTKDRQIIAFRYGKDDFSDKTFKIDVYDLVSYEKYLELIKNDGEIDLSKYQSITSFTSKLYYETSESDNNAFIYYPENLPDGWYLIDITVDGNKLQQFVQVSDIITYIQSLNGEALIWCNDVETGEAVSANDIKIGTKTYKTNANGVAIFEATGKNDVIIKTSDGKCFADYVDFDAEWEDKEYNIYVYTDREAYLPTDTINYWGMIVPQTTKVKLPKTIELYLDDTLIASDISVNSSGIFTGSFDVSNHISSYTAINLKINDEMFFGTDIMIEEYTKPTYILDFDFDKEYYRNSDIANISITGNYFDGNPASMVQVNLDIENYTESIELDKMGRGHVQYEVNSISSEYWEPQHIYANLQTSGADEYAGKGKSFIYFPTDYALQTEVVNDEIVIKSNLIDFNKVDIDKIEIKDIIGAPQSDIYGKVNIYRTDYIKRQVGSYYDFIDKTNKPKYEYKTNRVLIDTIEFATDVNGEARIPVEYEMDEDSYYSYEVKYVMPDDFAGIENGVIRENNNIYNDNYYYFDTGYKQLNAGEEVLVKISGSNGFNNEGKVLYAVLNEKLNEVALTHNTEFSLKFVEEYIPNVLLTGAYFDGTNIYRINRNYLYYNYEEKELDISITTDKEQYEPGETVKINVEAKDKNGKSAKTNMVISVVDEAAFALYEQYEYPLHSLHEFEYYYPMIYCSTSLVDNDAFGEGGGDGTYGEYRDFFKDTAAFLTIKTGSNGKTSASFKLPDNITSWRITAIGITDSLKAGVTTTNSISTVPFYTDVVMNKKYNINDDITFNLKTAGADLHLLSNSIRYTVDLIRNGEVIDTKVSYQLPFKSVNVNLGKVLVPGDYKLEIKSECGVYEDILVKEFSVENSLHEINITKDIDLNSEIDIEALRYPVTFMLYDVDNKLYYDTIEKSLKTSNGTTNEQKIAHNIVIRKLNELQEDDIEEIELQGLQNYDGGVSLYDYSSSDVLLTAKVCAAMPEGVNAPEAKKYFEKILANKESTISEITAAYFGLAVLKEPVLNDIRYILDNNSDLLLQDKLNLIAGLSYIGDFEGADLWYEKIIKSRLKDNESSSYIYSFDEYESYSTTSFLTMILAKINHQDFDKVVSYIIENDSKVYSPALDLTEYIKAYNPKTESAGYIKYLHGDKKEQTINFNGKNSVIFKFDENELKDFEILEAFNVVGKAMYVGTIDEAINLYDNNIKVAKEISKENKVGELRTVTIKINLPASANEYEYFIINDVIPNGTRYAGSKEHYNYSKDAQRVQIQLSRDNRKSEYVIQYNVRNVLSGEYAVESAVVSNPKTNDIGYSLEDKITIE